MKNAEHTRTNPGQSAGRMEGGLRVKGTAMAAVAGNPVVTVITIVRNGKDVLEQTIESVLRQSYKPIEYIIIDGASTDGTVDVIKKYNDKIAYWISEPDKGISDAFNKGIQAATGQFIALLNAHDRMSDNQIETGVRALQASSADYVFGDLLFHDAEGRILYRINGDPQYERIIHSKMPELCHPTVLARRDTYGRIGLFDLKYRYAMDYEWLLRLHTRGGKGLYVKDVVGNMGIGGASDSSFHKALKEVRDISIQYGEGRAKAHFLYLYRIVKGAGRRLLEKRIHGSVYHRLRKMFNPRYGSLT